MSVFACHVLLVLLLLSFCKLLRNDAMLHMMGRARTFVHLSNPIFKIFNLTCFVEPEFESGQFLINKRLHWRGLHLTWFAST